MRVKWLEIRRLVGGREGVGEGETWSSLLTRLLPASLVSSFHLRRPLFSIRLIRLSLVFFLRFVCVSLFLAHPS